MILKLIYHVIAFAEHTFNIVFLKKKNQFYLYKSSNQLSIDSIFIHLIIREQIL